MMIFSISIFIHSEIIPVDPHRVVLATLGCLHSEKAKGSNGPQTGLNWGGQVNTARYKNTSRRPKDSQRKPTEEPRAPRTSHSYPRWLL